MSSTAFSAFSLISAYFPDAGLLDLAQPSQHGRLLTLSAHGDAPALTGMVVERCFGNRLRLTGVAYQRLNSILRLLRATAVVACGRGGGFGLHGACDKYDQTMAICVVP